MSDKSGISSQVLSLPSGGGALKGIGETFSPDLFTGTGNLSVPLELPAGRHGFQPRLSLGYSTGNGNGPFGMGWQLSVPGVSRKTSKGVPRYLDQATGPSQRDTFVLSGAEDLVQIAGANGVEQFRPRTEGLFARIERDRSPGNDLWRVRSRDGLVSLYGTPQTAGRDPAALADPTNQARVFQWRLSQTSDPFGNRIEYDYLSDTSQDPQHPWAQLYLQGIRYLDYERDGQSRVLVVVSFGYEQRPDTFSDCRAGFDVRTRLRCRRIEVRTHPDNDVLVRTYELTYLDDPPGAVRPADGGLPPNGVSLLRQIQVVGHDGQAREVLPPLEFGYSGFGQDPGSIQSLSGVGASMPAQSLASADLELVGLFGNGLPDLVQMNGATQFWRNLGGGRFAAPEDMPEVPALVHLADPGVSVADLNGDGRADLLAQDLGGYFPLGFQGRWSAQGFVRYDHLPSVTLNAPDVRLMDLDGDGVVDALRTGAQDGFELFFNDPLAGWDRIETRPPLEDFPDLSLADPRVKLGDLNGDGLQDLVLVQQGQIDYWPYLGHGQWGPRVTMDPGPAGFPPPGEDFDPRRVLFGDVDGDGLDDLVYLQPRRVTIWINQAGNGWSDPLHLDDTPLIADLDGVRVADMLGAGTAGILWSTDLPQSGADAYQFLDLTGGVKPYLLDRVDNHRGAVTRIRCVPSTEFYLADADQQPTSWMTPLPFPVQVVERVEVIDEISHGKLTTTYRYHHGYWDGVEREFRGFGRVEQLDTETFEAFNTPGLHGTTTPFEPMPTQMFSPPLLTKTWFHQGPVGDEFAERSEADLSGEYWPGDPSTLPRPADTLQLLQSLPATQRADAIRSLRGQILRTELYALDGTPHQDHPFTVTESQYGIREENPPASRNTQRRRIFFPHPVAQRTTQWERGDQPMTQFAFNDQYDPYGQPRRQVSLAVPRYRDYHVAGTPGEPYLGTVTETRYAQRDDAHQYMVDRVCGNTSFEILNDGSLSLYELYRQIQAGTTPRKLFGQSFHYYDGNAFLGLPLSQLGGFGALVRSESLVLTEDILRETYQDPVNPGTPSIPPYLRPDGVTTWPAEYPQEFQDETPALAGYTFADGSDHRARGYFTAATRVMFDFHRPELPHRGLPVTMRDPLGKETMTAYDRPYHLLPTQVIDPVGLTVSAEYNYRVLQPRMVTDANGNRRAVTFSPLGLVTATAVMGKQGQQSGDTLQAPGSRLEYDFSAFVNQRQPVSVRSTIRQHHTTDTDVPLPKRDDTIETVQYSDGFGRLLQTRTQADDVLFGDPSFGAGVLSPDQASPSNDAVGRRRAVTDPLSMVVSGWQIYDNKGRVVEKYEPFFAVGRDYRAPSDTQLGQKTTMFYDPRGQLIRTINPDGSEQRVIYGAPRSLDNPDEFTPTPWTIFTYDANDNAGRTHPNESLPYQHHWNTPSSITMDALGRTVSATARNRDASKNPGDPPPPIQELNTYSTYDLRGNVLSVTDTLHRVAFRYTYDLTNRIWRTDSIDAGLRRTVLNGLGNEIERRDSKDALILQAYDPLHRLIRLWARNNSVSPITLRQRIEYGDAGIPNQTPAERAAMRDKNLLGQLQRHHDEAGLTTITTIDFKGNVLDKTCRVIADAPILAVFDQAPAHSWQVMPFQVDWQPAPHQTLTERENQLLETTAYQTTSSVDALNRIKRIQFPQDVEGRRRELRPEYNRAGGLQQVRLDDTVYVERITYDAKGQRTLIAYGNGVITRYAYDPHTFRLTRLRSEHYTHPDDLSYHPRGEALQDDGYDYDLVGNILSIHDRTPGSGIPNNPQAWHAVTAADPMAPLLNNGNALDRRFAYDPLYRLLSATGRECDNPPDAPPWNAQPSCTDLTRARAYTESYHYDPIGNLLRLEHRNDTGGFTREFTTETANNHLHHMQTGQNRYDYAYDANGNTRSETTSRHFEWNHTDQLHTFRTQTDGTEPSVHTHYLYDATGQRVKKLVRKQGGQIETTHYLDGVFEHHRWGPQSQTGQNNHVHVMDDRQRVALIRLGAPPPDDPGPAVQFNLSDHLGSSNVVVDHTGALVNREEFTPYGETSFGSFAKKRYRFTGKERDEESGLYYHGVRYYAPTLARWANCDPIGIVGGLNLYTYAADNPISLIDHFGMQPDTIQSNTQEDNLGPGEIIEVSGKTPPPGDVSWAATNRLIDLIPRSTFVEHRMPELRKNFNAEPDRSRWVNASGDWLLPESLMSGSPEDELAEFQSQVNAALLKRANQEYDAYYASKAADWEKSGRIMNAGGKIGNVIGGITVGVAAAGFGITALTSSEGIAGMYSLTPSVNTAITSTGGAGAAGALVNRIEQAAPTLARVPEVTASIAEKAMADAPLLSQQESVWLPKVREYVQLLQQGVQNVDPIKVGSGIIVEGHHRYVAARILGIDIPIQEWTSGRYSLPWSLVKFVE
jgi:RHS repeat-associated protein